MCCEMSKSEGWGSSLAHFVLLLWSSEIDKIHEQREVVLIEGARNWSPQASGLQQSQAGGQVGGTGGRITEVAPWSPLHVAIFELCGVVLQILPLPELLSFFKFGNIL